MNETKPKPFDISKIVVLEAFEQVKKNRGSCGVDGVTIKAYEGKLYKNLYKLWNRMSSGSYFPEAIRRVEIPKANGKMRPLGIPTVEDRIAQTIVKLSIEPRLEEIFSDNSYGSRPGRSAIEAVAEARKNNWKYDYVIDLDIKGFFDNIDHELLLKACAKHIKEEWILLYLKRWLEAEVEMPNGERVKSNKGTPQGGVISPLLANLFLHYVNDLWLEKNYPSICYERYVDDVIT